jgi:dGTPase
LADDNRVETSAPLQPYACNPEHTRGRHHAEPDGTTRGPRTAFQRDRDRIIHSIAFRRLRHKTQVFVAPDGDHFRVRLTHSLEVAQIGRTIARALGLNEDLTEALCLAHDIGHPPFGHAGEHALDAALENAGGFDHNGNSLRILTQLESPYPLWPGLNLSWEMLEGMAKHNGPVPNPGWAMAAVNAGYDLALGSYASLEAQVAAIADDIAYDNHDIDDGLRAGILDFDDVLTLPFVKTGWDDVTALYPGVDPKKLRAELIRRQIGAMVNDVIAETRHRIAASGVETVDDVRALDHALCGFSIAMEDQEKTHKSFMYKNLYHHPSQIEAAAIARHIVSELYGLYTEKPQCLPPEWQASAPQDPLHMARHISDFIAGMTDRYAINRYREHLGVIDLPEGF